MRRCTNEAIVGENGCYRCYTDLQVERFTQLNTEPKVGYRVNISLWLIWHCAPLILPHSH